MNKSERGEISRNLWPTFIAGEVADGFNVVGRKLLTTLLALRERGGGGIDYRLLQTQKRRSSVKEKREGGWWMGSIGRERGRLLSGTSAVNNGMGSIEYIQRAGGRAMK